MEPSYRGGSPHRAKRVAAMRPRSLAASETKVQIESGAAGAVRPRSCL